MRCRRAACAVALLFVAACAQVGAPPATPVVDTAALVWPPPPDAAKIAYVASIAGSRDLGVTHSFLRRLAESIAGASEEHLVRPAGVATQGNVLAIADPGAPALFIFNRASQRFRSVTHANGTDLVSPVGVAVIDENTVCLADSRLGHIFVYDGDGELRHVWGGEELSRPTALAFDRPRQRLYVTDTGTHRILAYDTAGKLLFTFGQRGDGDGELNWPSHLCVDGAGSVYVIDALNFRVEVFDADGHFLSKFGHHGDGSGDFARPKGIAVDSQGHIYVADALFDTVQIFDQQGQFLLGFGRQGNAPGEFWLPGGLAIDADDRIYVADSYNQRLQVFQFVGAH